MTNAVPLNIDADRARVIVGDARRGKAHVMHCNYYNNFLLRTIWKDAGDFVESERILLGAAVEQSYFQLRELFDLLKLTDVRKRRSFASQFYAWQGFGLLDLTGIGSAGGVAVSHSQHYAEGWKEQFGIAEEPVGFWTRGWLAGAASAIFDLPQGHFATHQSECAAMTGGQQNVFEIAPGPANYPLFDGSAIGPLSAGHRLLDGPGTNVDVDAVRSAVLTLPLFGSEAIDDGLIRNFDVMITWHPHQYYDRISIECINEAVRRFGVEGRRAIEPLLEEAGHRCGFRTFGGLWRSPEWEAIVEPMCETREDWLFGLLAIINCAGWGRIQCTKLTRDEAVFVVHDDYESIGYLNLYGEADFPPSYLLSGGLRGIMNLLYNGEIQSKPALTEEFYQRLCRRSDAYRSIVEKSVAMGDDVSIFRITRNAA